MERAHGRRQADAQALRAPSGDLCAQTGDVTDDGKGRICHWFRFCWRGVHVKRLKRPLTSINDFQPYVSWRCGTF
jgi:hypothetical protein